MSDTPQAPVGQTLVPLAAPRRAALILVPIASAELPDLRRADAPDRFHHRKGIGGAILGLMRLNFLSFIRNPVALSCLRPTRPPQTREPA